MEVWCFEPVLITDNTAFLADPKNGILHYRVDVRLHGTTIFTHPVGPRSHGGPTWMDEVIDDAMTAFSLKLKDLIYAP